MRESLNIHEVAIIGAGLGGITVAAGLLEKGIDDIVILDRAEALGGTWQANTYPGVGVDIPSVLYQFPFARKPDWSRFYSPGEEVRQYLEDVCRSLGLDRKMRFGANVVREVFDDAGHFWRLTTDTGDEVTARFVVTAKGPFLKPIEDPGIDGLDDFAGKLQRPARWDHSYDHRGKRVAVIGTGASSIQLVPALAPDVATLDVYQRTATWILPYPNFDMPAVGKALLGAPGVAATVNHAVLRILDAVSRVAYQAPPPVFERLVGGLEGGLRTAYRGYLRAVVDDPADRAVLVPKAGVVGKRPTGSTTFFGALNRDNTSLITTPIERITERGIRTTDGVEHAVDMLVLATGYEMHNDHRSYPVGSVVGRGGFDQGELFERDGIQAYETVAVKGIPNRWMTSGPFCWTGGIDWFRVVEVGAMHAVRAIAEAHRRGATLVEVSADAHDRHHAEVLRRRGNLTAYFAQQQALGVNTYFLDSRGESTAIRPTAVLEARRRAVSFAFDDYVFERVAAVALAA